MTHTCYGCANLEHCSESWEMPHIRWYECAVHGGYANLKSFPFHNTKCPDWVRSSWKKSELERSCTCHPDDNPPRPCPKKYAFSECVEAARKEEPK